MKKYAVVSILAMMASLCEEADANESGCPICGNHSKNETGECSHCGTYRCKECNKYHIGDPSWKCTEEGVDIPDANHSNS